MSGIRIEKWIAKRSANVPCCFAGSRLGGEISTRRWGEAFNGCKKSLLHSLCEYDSENRDINGTQWEELVHPSCSSTAREVAGLKRPCILLIWNDSWQGNITLWDCFPQKTEEEKAAAIIVSDSICSL